MSHERMIHERDSLQRHPGPLDPGGLAAPVAITVNGAAREVAAGTTVADLVRLLGMDGRRVAVAVNHAVIPRSRHPHSGLGADDRVEILEAVGGG
jgi:sulfur carrier protein